MIIFKQNYFFSSALILTFLFWSSISLANTPGIVALPQAPPPTAAAPEAPITNPSTPATTSPQTPVQPAPSPVQLEPAQNAGCPDFSGIYECRRPPNVVQDVKIIIHGSTLILMRKDRNDWSGQPPRTSEMHITGGDGTSKCQGAMLQVQYQLKWDGNSALTFTRDKGDMNCTLSSKP